MRKNIESSINRLLTNFFPALQKHLSVHDDGDENVKTDSDTEDPAADAVDKAEMKRRRNLISQNIMRKRMQSVKKLKVGCRQKKY